MGISKIAQNVINTPWTLTDDFQFIITNNAYPLQISGAETVKDVFDKSIKSVDLPQMGSDTQHVMMGGEWRIYNSKHQPFTFSVVFRDFSGLSLRSYFVGLWIAAQRDYFDEAKSTINISVGGRSVFKSEHCLISSVSQVQFDNENSSIAEFSVEFASPYFSNDKIAMFGTYKFKVKAAAATKTIEGS